MSYKVEIWTDDHDFWYTEQDAAAACWASEHCPSYDRYQTLDISDFNNSANHPDSGAIYHFGTEEDAFLFRLTWGR